MTDHAALTGALDARLTEVWEAYRKVADTAFDLTLQAICHYARSLTSDAVWIHLEVTDQGGDSMTFLVLTDATGEDVLQTHPDIDEDDLENAMLEYAMGLEDHQLQSLAPMWEWTGHHTSGSGRLNIDLVLAAYDEVTFKPKPAPTKET